MLHFDVLHFEGKGLDPLTCGEIWALRKFAQ